ncbi:hypothetical protein KCP77_06300 [Salmonella enterica subsp. enterica]|nr:hypothetical protein KCP77_06300 [Salmonella enterica subsp. enterica]
MKCVKLCTSSAAAYLGRREHERSGRHHLTGFLLARTFRILTRIKLFCIPHGGGGPHGTDWRCCASGTAFAVIAWCKRRHVNPSGRGVCGAVRQSASILPIS